MVWLLAFVGHPILIGWMAQAKRLKGGVLWALLAFVVDGTLGLFMNAVMHSREILEAGMASVGHPYNPLAVDITFALFVFIPTTIIFVLAIHFVPLNERDQQVIPPK